MEKDRLNHVLRKIEYPGEEEKAIADYLSKMDVASIIMVSTHKKVKQMKTAFWWGALFIFNALLLLSFSFDSLQIQNYFMFHNIFKTIVFSFLAILLFGSMIGLILNMDTKWLRRYIQVD